jgi:hypothetical protein
MPPAPASINILVNFMMLVIPPKPASASAIIGTK